MVNAIVKGVTELFNFPNKVEESARRGECSAKKIQEKNVQKRSGQ